MELLAMATPETSDLLHFSYREDAARYAGDRLANQEDPSQRAVIALWGKHWSVETRQLEYVSALVAIEPDGSITLLGILM